MTKLTPRLRRRGHQVETVAIGGLDTRRAVALQLRSEPADWTIFCFGANDLAPWKRILPSEFATNYAALLKRANSSDVLVVGPAPVKDAERPDARNNSDVAYYSAIASEVAQPCGAEFISLAEHVGPTHLADDGVHLNDRGYDILELLAAKVVEPPGDLSDSDEGQLQERTGIPPGARHYRSSRGCRSVGDASRRARGRSTDLARCGVRS